MRCSYINDHYSRKDGPLLCRAHGPISCGECAAQMCAAHAAYCQKCGMALCQRHAHDVVWGCNETLRKHFLCTKHEVEDRMATRPTK